jgi:hypothetical protein
MEEFIQLVSVLFSLSDFGVAQNAKAPPPAEVSKYGVEDADVFLFVDLDPVVAKNYRAFVALRDKKEIQAVPELRAGIDRAVTEAEAGRQQAKKMFGVDPVTDVKSFAVWVKLGAGEPTGVVAVRGAFPPTWLDSAGHLAQGQKFEVDGQKAVLVGDAAVARTRDGQVLIGTRALVEERLKKGWKAPAGKAGAAAEVRAALGERPLFTVVFAPGPAGRQQMIARAADDPGLRDIAAALSQVRFSLLRNGISWRYVATDKDGFQAAVLASEGLLDLMRASHLFARALARLILSGVRTHARSEPKLAAIVAREKELLQLVDSATGDGRFAASVQKNAAKNTVTVKATGRRLSEVVPVVGVLAAAGAGFAMVGVRKKDVAPPAFESAQAPAVAAPQPIPAGRPLDVRGVYRRAKQKRAGSGRPW